LLSWLKIIARLWQTLNFCSMISITDLVACYGSRKILNHINWSLDSGMIHGLVGLNGSGKTTLLKTMYGLIKPVSGVMTLDEQPFNKRFISLLDTEPYFYHGINGSEYLSLFKSDKAFNFIAGEWALLFHLELTELIDNYSTGMKKKLALLGIIKANKPFILLDEPFNGLDLESSRVLTAVLKKMKEQGKTIVITSHMLETLTGLCDRIHYLKDGIIRKTYKPEDADTMKSEIFHELDRQIENKINQLLSEG
jgi:ABC-2 type transport system ATP-binding protein